MNVSLKKTLIFLAGTIFSFGVFLLAPSAEAATSTVRGKAYWGDYGYIYFHCIDDVIGERFDEAQNLAGGNKYQPPLGQNLFHFYSAPCTDLVHGVEINTEGLLSGSAWNPSVGLINFFGGDAPEYGFNSACHVQCTQTNNCIGCYNFNDQRVYGYAQIEATGEYISLSKSGTLVNIYTKAGTPVYPLTSGISLGDFAGTAVMDSGTKPNISFNCRTENYPGADTCASRQHRVYISGLMIGRLSAPNWSYASACSSGALRAVLRWEKYAGMQSAFEVVVNDENVLSTTTGEYICWSGKKNQSETFQYIISNDPSNHDCGGRLQYNTPYYWWVRGYDADGKATDWVQYDTNTITDTDQNLDGNPMTFQTFRHEFPSPFFTWSPFNVTTGTTTTFTSASFAYDDANPTLHMSCDPARCPGYLWTTSDTDALISATTSPITDIHFFTATNTSITLQVTDYAGYVCSTSTVLRINYDLPLWREVRTQ